MERYTCRKNPAFYLIALFCASLLAAACMFVGTQSAWADDGIKLGEPYRLDNGQSYKLPNLTVQAPDNTSFRTIIISLDKGSLDLGDGWNSNIVQEINYDSSLRTIIATFKEGTSSNQIQASLRGVKFVLPSANATQKPRITLSTRNTSLPSGTIIQAVGTGAFYEHFYISINGQTANWFNAYNMARNYSIMGRTGYLATITSADEDKMILDQGGYGLAWLGCTRALFNGTRANDNVTLSSSTASLPNDHSNTAYYWACGPEAGKPCSEIGFENWKSGEPSYSESSPWGYIFTYFDRTWMVTEPWDANNIFIEFGGYGNDDPGYVGEAEGQVEFSNDPSEIIKAPVPVTGLTLSSDQPYYGYGATAITATVAPANASYVTYQWYRTEMAGDITNGTAIDGATTSSYTPTADDAGYYLYCKATGESSSSATAITGNVAHPHEVAITYATQGIGDETITNGEDSAGSTFAVPTASGATFQGWYLEETCDTLFANADGTLALATPTTGYIANDGTWSISTAALTLYPKWARIGDAESVARMFVANPQNGTGDDAAWESNEIAVTWDGTAGTWSVTLKQDINAADITLAELQSNAGITVNVDLDGHSILGASSTTESGTAGLTIGDRVLLSLENGLVQGGNGTTGGNGITIEGTGTRVTVGADATVRGGKSITAGGASGDGIATASGGSGTVNVTSGSVEGGTSEVASTDGGDGISGDTVVNVTGGSVAGGDGTDGENGSDGGDGGDGIATTSTVAVSDGEISGGAGGNGGDATGSTDGGDGGNGGTGISSLCDVEVTGGEVSGGSGGDGGSAESGAGGAGGAGGSSLTAAGGTGGDGGNSISGNGGDGGNGGSSDTGDGGAGGAGGSSTDGDGGAGGTGGTSNEGAGGAGGTGGNSTNGSAGAGGAGGLSTKGDTGAGGAGGSSVNGTAGAGGAGSPAGDSGTIDYSPADTFVSTYLKDGANIFSDVNGTNYEQIISGSDAWDALSDVQQEHVNQMLTKNGNAEGADTYPELLATATAGTLFTSLFLTDDEVIYTSATAANCSKIIMGSEPWDALSDASKAVVNAQLTANGNNAYNDTYPELLTAATAIREPANAFIDTYLTGDNGIFKTPTAENNAQIVSGADAWDGLSADTQTVVNDALAANGNSEAYDTYPELLAAAQEQVANAQDFVDTYLAKNDEVISEPSADTAAKVISGNAAWNDLTTEEQNLVNATLAVNGNQDPFDTYEGLYTYSRAILFAQTYLTEDGSLVTGVTDSNKPNILAGEEEWTRMSQDERNLVNGMLAENGNNAANDTYEELLAQAKGEDEPEITAVSVWRLYNPGSGDHLYTTSAEERQIVIEAGWRDEGVAFVAPSQKGDPVYRVYNPVVGGHHYTTSAAERDALVKGGWNDEGVAFLSADPDKGSPVRRLYNPNPGTVCHLFTTSLTEASNVEAAGWNAEGIAFYALS